jgi:hypothetical protein
LKVTFLELTKRAIKDDGGGRRWLTPVILPNYEAEIKRIAVQNQLWQMVRDTLSRRKHHNTGGVAQGVGPEFKPQYRKNSNNNSGNINSREWADTRKRRNLGKTVRKG